MIPDDWYIKKSLEYSQEDAELFDRATGHLPKRVDSTPFHSGPHSVKHLRAALNIAYFAGWAEVLEIGFCLGHSASLFMELGAKHVVTTDVSDRQQTLEAIKLIDSADIDFVWRSELEKMDPINPDLAYIDGDHSLAAIVKDTELCLRHGAKYILYDDYWPHWGDTQEAMKQLNLYPLAIIGTMAICKIK